MCILTWNYDDRWTTTLTFLILQFLVVSRLRKWLLMFRNMKVALADGMRKRITLETHVFSWSSTCTVSHTNAPWILGWGFCNPCAAENSDQCGSTWSQFHVSWVQDWIGWMLDSYHDKLSNLMSHMCTPWAYFLVPWTLTFWQRRSDRFITGRLGSYHFMDTWRISNMTSFINIINCPGWWHVTPDLWYDFIQNALVSFQKLKSFSSFAQKLQEWFPSFVLDPLFLDSSQGTSMRVKPLAEYCSKET